MKDHAPYMKLRTKLALLMSALIALISLFLIWYLPERMRDSARSSLVDTATSVAAMSAYGLAEVIGTGEPPASAPILRALRENSDLVFLVVTDMNENVLASFNERLADEVEYAAGRQSPDANRTTPAGSFTDDGRIYQTVATIRHQGRPIGRLYLGLSMDRHLAGVRSGQRAVVASSISFLILGTLGSWILASLLTAPLEKIVRTTRKISRGARGERADVTAGTEVGELAESFNEMLERLESTQADLETLNMQLEQRVIERTERFRQEAERRLQAQEALLSSQARYANLVEQNLAGVYVATPEGKILSANPALARMMQFESVREFIEFGSIPYLDPDHRRKMVATLADKGVIMNSEVQLKRKDGKEVWALENARLDPQENQIEGIVLDITERKRSEMEIEYRAHHDPLTGLPNRNLLQDRLFMAISTASRLGLRVAVVFLDVDDLKDVNDVLGHAIGDEVLKSIGRRMSASVRETDTVARIGGDEFVIVFPNLAEDQSVETLIEKVRESLREPIVIENEQILVKASMGLAVFPADGHDPDTLIQNADSVMYRVKLKGGDGIRTYSDGESSAGIRRSSLEKELREAIENGELVPWYQPQFDLQTRQLMGVEALARWTHPDGVVIQPSGFIPLAERTGLILPLGETVLRQGCADLRRWQQRSPDFQLAVNVSARQFHQQNFLDMVAEVISAQTVDPGSVELEITESLAIQKSGWTIELLNRLRGIGVRIAVDDFGTGKSSLTYLKNYPIDTVKIDQEFIRGMLENPHDHSIVTAILLLSDSLELRTIAEGIETREQLEYLSEQGCGYGQGYYFARPMPADEIDALFAKGSGNAPAGDQSSSEGAAPAEGSTNVASPLTASTTDPYEKNEP